MRNSSHRKKRGREGHYVYIVRCAGGELYTGYTINPKRRLRQHNEGKGAKFTRSRVPVALVHVEKFGNKSEALRREFSIKRLSRKEKLHLIAVPKHITLELTRAARATARRSSNSPLPDTFS